jgi:hypothetical protein
MLDFEERVGAIVDAAIERLIIGALAPWRVAGRATQ